MKGDYMGIDELLEYQKIDISLTNARKSILESDKAKTINDLGTKAKHLKATIEAGEKSATACFDSVYKIKRYLDDIPPRSAINVDTLTYEQLSKLENELNSHKTHLERLKKEFESNNEKLSQLNIKHNAEYHELIKVSNSRSSKMIDFKKIVDKFTEDHDSETELLKEIAKRVPRRLLTLYNEKKTNGAHKTPIVVKYADGSCGACGYDIKAEVGNKLKKPGDYAECPNCLRIVFFK
jgi:predicted  nucleic acid-binding Zn-ribbon protein